jgi:hypothetical protein
MIPTTILDAMWRAKNALGHTNHEAPPAFTCNVCHAIKVTTWQAIDEGRGFWTDDTGCVECTAKEESERTRRALRKRFDAAGVPPIHQVYTLRSRTQPCGRVSLPDVDAQIPAASTAVEYKVPSWICLAGPVGTGKTTILSALLCDLIVKDRCQRTFQWDTESGLFKKADLAAEKSHSARVRVIQSAAKATVLMLDDLAGNRRGLTDWQGGAIRDLIDERHRYQRPTLFTTNMTSWKHLEQRYGSHVVSRMIEASTGLMLVEGSDLRYGVDTEWCHKGGA